MERLIFQLLIFFLPTQLAYHFWPEWAHVFGIRVDYLAPAIYLTDILIALLFVFWVVDHKYQRLNIKDQKYKVNIKNIRTIVLLIGFIAINTYFANSEYAAIYKWGKVSEFVLLGLYIVRNREFELNSWFIKPLAYSVVVFSTIGILQFIKSSTLGGPLYYFGERSFDTGTPGIALVTLWGREFLRAYSTFPHPNAFAGFLAVSIVFILTLKNNTLKRISLALGAVALVLTFSLGAFIAILFSLAFYLTVKNRKELARPLIMGILTFALLSSVVFSIYSSRISPNYDFPETIRDRVVMAEKSWRVFVENPIIGIGLNNFFAATNSLQPVHNIFLLVLSETGTAGLIIFYYLFFLSFEKSLFTNHYSLITVLLVIIITGLVDHYWLTLQQNQLLLSIILGLSLRRNV